VHNLEVVELLEPPDELDKDLPDLLLTDVLAQLLLPGYFS
jgi:hypothetical protein